MTNEVVVYSSTGCPHCHSVKEQLKEWAIPFEERNVSEVKEYFDQLQARKIFGTPATLINNKLVLGFQPAKMKKLLGMEEEPVVENIKEKPHQEGENDYIFKQVNESVLSEVYDLVIIGAGPAGASAATYAARGKLKTLVIDKAPAAGTLAITHKIANYPGVRQTLTGLELLTEMHLQAFDFGAKFVRSQVLSVDFSDTEVKKLELPEGTIKTKSVFISVGAKAPSSKIKGEEEFTGRGVSYCSTCDAAFFENKVVVVVGDNEEAVHETEALSKFCKEVRLLIPSGTIKGQADLSHLEQKKNVSIYKRHRVKDISGEHAVEKIRIVDDQKQENEWEVDGVFLYLAGMKPGTDFLKDSVARDSEGYINVDDHMRTNIEGVFAGGDARRTPIKQAVISASDGCIAALTAEQYVNKRTNLRPQYS